jgi:hypothetical protein
MVKERLFTAKELAFIAAYQEHGDGARAAVAAGYSPKGAAKTALAVAEKQRPGHHYVSGFFFAEAYVGLGEKDQALTWLERA